MADLLQDKRKALIAERQAANAAKVAPTASTQTNETLPDYSVPDSFNFSETIRGVASEVGNRRNQEGLDARFEALGLGSMKGSQVTAGFMGKLISGFKDAQDRGVLNVMGEKTRQMEAVQAEKDKAQAVAIKMIDTLIDRGGLSSLSGSVLRSYEESAGYQPGYLSALKEAEIELEDAQKSKDDIAIKTAEQQLENLKLTAERTRAGTSAITAETKDLYGDVSQSKTSITKNQDGSFTFGDAVPGRTECGEWLNDTMGTPNAFGSTFLDKFKNTPLKVPASGGTFSSNMGSYGHCGAVNMVHPDGSITITDYNRGMNGKKQTTKITPNANGEYILDGVVIAGFGSGVSVSEDDKLYESLPKDEAGNIDRLSVEWSDLKSVNKESAEDMIIYESLKSSATTGDEEMLSVNSAIGRLADVYTVADVENAQANVESLFANGDISEDELMSFNVASQMRKTELRESEEGIENTIIRSREKSEKQATNTEEIARKEEELKNKREELEDFESKDESELKGYQIAARRSKRNKLNDDINVLERSIGKLKGELGLFGQKLD